MERRLAGRADDTPRSNADHADRSSARSRCRFAPDETPPLVPGDVVGSIHPQAQSVFAHRHGFGALERRAEALLADL